MSEYVDAIVAKKPNDFKDLVIQGLHQRIRDVISTKRDALGKSMFTEDKESITQSE